MIKKLIITALLSLPVFILLSCLQEQKKAQITYTEEEILSESKKANDFFDNSFDAALDRNPEQQTFLSIKKDYDKWTNRSDSMALAENKIIEGELEYLRTNINFEKLDEKTKLSFRCFEFQAQQQISMFPWRFHNYPVNQMDGLQSAIPAFLINMHRIDSVSDARAYIARLNGIGPLFDQIIEGLRIRDSLGINLPKFVFPMVLDDCKNIVKGIPFDQGYEKSPLFEDFTSKVSSLNTVSYSEKNELLRLAANALVEVVQPAYQKLISELKQLEEHASNDDGAWKFPSGDRFYKAALYNTTTTDMTPDEIFETGEREVKRIHAEMREIIQKLNKKDDSLIWFFEFLRENKQFYFPNTPEGRKQYMTLATGIIDTMRSKLDMLFLTKPVAPIVVKAVEPFREKSAGGAFYEDPAQDGSRPGTYYINLYDMKDQPIYQAEALAYHEGIPGHHMQIAIAQELTGIPKFRQHGGNVAYVEGWALYAELIPKEYGFYQDPYSDFGRLANEVFRAARLVVDVGIHHKKWTREQAYQYFIRNTPNPEGDCRKEIDRYIVWPSQATGYKIGMLKILELRERAQKELGNNFDIREFHDVILTSGPLPLKLLSENVREWINGKKNQK
ncbi:MAG: DUF885 domain-containing protein [Bacteroidetes bacterium]|nr:MAG: DUF885 domain-containing protein [Bacteroidota bacterium]